MEKQKIDCSMINLVNGKIKVANNKLDNLKMFIERWEEKIKEIKLFCLDNQQAYNLANDHLSEVVPFMYGDGLSNKLIILNQLSHDLSLALFQSNNNYRKQFPSIWDRFHKLKLPDLNIIKK